MAGVGGTLCFLVTLDDDRIEALEVEIGLGHRGFEKEVESRPWHEALPYVARLGYASGPIAQVGYCLALEATGGPRRPRARDLAAHPRLRARPHHRPSRPHRGALDRDRCERGGARGAARRGRRHAAPRRGGRRQPARDLGASRAASPATCRRISASIWARSRSELEATLERLAVLLLDHPTAAQRLVDVAPLGADACLALGVTGPCLRAAGHRLRPAARRAVSRVRRARFRRPDRRAGRRLRSTRRRRRGDPAEPADGRAMSSTARDARAGSR